MKNLLFLLAVAPSMARSQTGVIKGVITYYFNEYQGDKPDVGAKIFVVDTSNIAGFRTNLCDSFHQANGYRNLAASYENMGSKVPQNIHAKLVQYGAESKESFTDMDRRNFDQLLRLFSDSKTKKAVVDGVGNFSIQVPVSTYYVFIQSNGRKGITASEIMGKAFVTMVKVGVGEDVDVSNRFDQY